jgi:hypothetical protein
MTLNLKKKIIFLHNIMPRFRYYDSTTSQKSYRPPSQSYRPPSQSYRPPSQSYRPPSQITRSNNNYNSSTSGFKNYRPPPYINPKNRGGKFKKNKSRKARHSIKHRKNGLGKSRRNK